MYIYIYRYICIGVEIIEFNHVSTDRAAAVVDAGKFARVPLSFIQLQSIINFTLYLKLKLLIILLSFIVFNTIKFLFNNYITICVEPNEFKFVIHQ